MQLHRQLSGFDLVTHTPLSHTSSKERIIRIAAQLFAERGYHAVGVNDICVAAGLSRGALYHYINSKEEILEEICGNYMMQLGDLGRRALEQEADPVSRLRRLGYDLVDIISRHKAELTVCFRELQSFSTADRRKKVLALHADYEELWIQVLKAGHADGKFRPYSKVQLKGLLGMYYYSYIWLRPELIQETADTFHDIVLRAISLDGGSAQRQER